MTIVYCCNCKKKVEAKLVTGLEIYPHIPQLQKLKFLQCPTCKGYVGTHKNSDGKPLGCIPSEEIKNARQEIHKILDPLWKSGKYTRSKLYELIANEIGRNQYHTANIRTIEEARAVYRAILKIKGK